VLSLHVEVAAVTDKPPMEAAAVTVGLHESVTGGIVSVMLGLLTVNSPLIVPASEIATETNVPGPLYWLKVIVPPFGGVVVIDWV